MADQVAVVSFLCPPTTGTVDVTSSDITESFSAAIFFWGGFDDPADDTDNANIVAGVGACTATATSGSAANRHYHVCVQGNGSGGLNAPDYNKHIQSAACIRIINGTNANATRVLASYDSSISGGVRLNFTTVDVTMHAKVTAILFAGLSDASLNRVTTSGTSTVSEQCGNTGARYQPDILFWFGQGAAGSASSDAVLGLGFTERSSPIRQTCANVDLGDLNEPSDDDGEVNTTKSYMLQNGTRTTMVRSGVTTFNSDGFSFAGDAASPNISAEYLALKFSGFTRSFCETATIAASASVQTFSPGFSPKLVLGQSTLFSATDTYTNGATAAATGILVTGPLASRAIAIHGQNGLSGNGISFNCHTRMEDSALLTYDHNGTIVHRATWNGGTQSGFGLDFSAGSSAGQLTYLAIRFGVDESDTEAISDEVVFVASVAHGETEGISDGLAMSAALTVDETEEVGDGFFGMPVPTERTFADPAGTVLA